MIKWPRWWSSAETCSNGGEEERGAVSGSGCSGAEVPFYRGRGGRRVTIMADIGGEMDGCVNGDFSALKLRFKGGVTVAI
jgi:hypothetical protein